MADKMTPAERSSAMSKVPSKNTSPERLIRSILFSGGFRFRLHSKKLPGRPDIVLPKFRTAVFVHGCFWHGHHCKAGKLSETNIEFWQDKITKNRERDAFVLTELRKLGWRTLIVWECVIKGSGKKNLDAVSDCLFRWIRGKNKNGQLSIEDMP